MFIPPHTCVEPESRLTECPKNVGYRGSSRVCVPPGVRGNKKKIDRKSASKNSLCCRTSFLFTARPENWILISERARDDGSSGRIRFDVGLPIVVKGGGGNKVLEKK